MGKRVIFIFAVLLSAYSGKATESPAGNPLAANPEYQEQPAPAKTNAGATAETDPAPGRPAAKQDREASHSPRHDSASRVKKTCRSAVHPVALQSRAEKRNAKSNWKTGKNVSLRCCRHCRRQPSRATQGHSGAGHIPVPGSIGHPRRGRGYIRPAAAVILAEAGGS